MTNKHISRAKMAAVRCHEFLPRTSAELHLLLLQSIHSFQSRPFMFVCRLVIRLTAIILSFRKVDGLTF